MEATREIEREWRGVYEDAWKGVEKRRGEVKWREAEVRKNNILMHFRRHKMK